MRTDRIRRLAALAALVAAGCVDQSPVSPSARSLIVHAVLDAGTSDQYIVVQSTTGIISEQRAIPGATVRVVLPDGRLLTAEESHDSTLVAVQFGEPIVKTLYHLSLSRSSASLVGGARYQLLITVPDGRTVSGSTTLPALPAVTRALVQATFDRERDTLRLVWPRVAGARAYEVRITSPRSSYTMFSDTSIALAGTLRSEDSGYAFAAGQTHHVVISAVDSNYYDYYRTSSDFLTGGGVLNTLQGAIGVFGSIVPIMTADVVVR